MSLSALRELVRMTLVTKKGDKIIKIHDCIIDPTKRVFSGIKAILDFQIINFREYDCTKEPESPNCRIVELFLTVDTTRKMQNGVNIDISLDRCEFCDFHINSSNNIFKC